MYYYFISFCKLHLELLALNVITIFKFYRGGNLSWMLSRPKVVSPHFPLSRTSSKQPSKVFVYHECYACPGKDSDYICSQTTIETTEPLLCPCPKYGGTDGGIQMGGGVVLYEHRNMKDSEAEMKYLQS